MPTVVPVMLGFLLTACASSSPALDKASIGGLTFGAPSGWTSRDLSSPQRTMFEWTPSDNPDNQRKEALVVLRSDRPGRATATPAQLHTLLRDAQRVMPGGAFSTPVSFTTRHGFRGARIEGSFSPPGASTTYRRMHAVLVDGTAAVNVLYTARDPDRESFDAVLDSFFREGV